MSNLTIPSSLGMKTHDDKTVFKAHNSKANFSRNTKRACAGCMADGAQDVAKTGLKVCSRCKRMWYCVSPLPLPHMR